MKIRHPLTFALITFVIAAAPAMLPKSGTLQDMRLREASGLAVSRIIPELYWAINDSGNAPILFALDRTGAALGRVRVANTLNRDWEALGSGPCPQDHGGHACLYLADTGDNDANRDDIRIEIVPEPAPNATAEIVAFRTLAVTFEDGPRDVEALLVHPQTGELYLIEKLPRAKIGNSAALYHLDVVRGQNKAIAKRCGTIPSLATSGDAVGRITDGAFVPDGKRLVLRDLDRTYVALWRDDPANPLRLTPFPSPSFRQGEALAVSSDGKSVVLTSEGRASPIVQVDLPD
jgi:hypothetical protein